MLKERPVNGQKPTVVLYPLIPKRKNYRGVELKIFSLFYKVAENQGFTDKEKSTSKTKSQ